MRETTMKARNVLLGLLLGAIVLFPACSSNSPTAPPPSPTPVAFSISLTASPAEALVNGGILLSARVTSGGRDVPDNTSVTFTISSCVPNQNTSPGFGENMLVMTCETTRTTKAGVATATIWSGIEGTFEVVARVPGQSAKLPVRWTQPINPGTLAVYSVTPNRGRPEGGQQVLIYGRGFAKPIAVDFIVGNDIGHAQVLNVNAAGTEITAVTPPVAGTVTSEVVADVRVTAAFGTSSQVSDTLQAATPTSAPSASRGCTRWSRRAARTPAASRSRSTARTSSPPSACASAWKKRRSPPCPPTTPASPCSRRGIPAPT